MGDRLGTAGVVGCLYFFGGRLLARRDGERFVSGGGPVGLSLRLGLPVRIEPRLGVLPSDCRFVIL